MLSLPGAQANGSGHPGSSHVGRGIRPMSPHSYADYSPDMLLTASIDGQVVIWDRRQRERAGRLDMGDRCPPWCISVRRYSFARDFTNIPARRLAGLPMARRYMQGEGTGRSTCGTCDKLGHEVKQHLGCSRSCETLRARAL